MFCDKNGRVSRLGPGSVFPDCDLINYSFGENIEHELLQHIGAQVSREWCRDAGDGDDFVRKESYCWFSKLYFFLLLNMGSNFRAICD